MLGQAALSLVWDIGQHLRRATGEQHSKEYLFQRITIAVQRGDAAAVLGTLGRREDPFWGVTEGHPPPFTIVVLYLITDN